MLELYSLKFLFAKANNRMKDVPTKFYLLFIRLKYFPVVRCSRKVNFTS